MGALAAAIERAGAGPLIVHTDLFQVRGAVARVRDLNALMDRHVAAIHQAAGAREVFFPTFNYDFFRTRHYDVAAHPCQVGTLNEHVRTCHAGWRSPVPAFHFCARQHPAGFRVPGLDPAGGDGPAQAASGKDPGALPVDPFGAGSLFDYVRARDGAVVMYGADFSAFTALHHVESLAGPPLYRYDKAFEGTVCGSDSRTRPVRLTCHMRPLGQAMDYAWDALRDEAIRAGLIEPIEASGARALVVPLAPLARFWSDKLAQDPLALLDAESRAWVDPMLARIGGRFRLEQFESD
jgi:aminoglycoside N3'-acetyltransferase